MVHICCCVYIFLSVSSPIFKIFSSHNATSLICSILSPYIHFGSNLLSNVSLVSELYLLHNDPRGLQAPSTGHIINIFWRKVCLDINSSIVGGGTKTFGIFDVFFLFWIF